MARIFINYRRADSVGYANGIFDRLSAHFGQDSVVRDLDSIPAGVDFVKFLNDAVGKCEVMVTLIGQDWLNAQNAAGSRRLDDPLDYVRIELSRALALDIPVIPVLLQEADMPAASLLPEDLVQLTNRNALEISDSRWAYDVDRLIRSVERLVGMRDPAPTEVLAVAPPPVETPAADPAPESSKSKGAGLPEGRKKLLLVGIPLLLIVIGTVLFFTLGGTPEGDTETTATEEEPDPEVEGQVSAITEEETPPVLGPAPAPAPVVKPKVQAPSPSAAPPAPAVVPQPAAPSPAPAAPTADRISGNWSGTAYETSGASFPVSLDIRQGCQVGQKCGTVHVPSCNGDLTLYRIIGANQFEFTAGPFVESQGCTFVQGGEYLDLNSDGSLHYHTNYGPYGRLTK